MDTLHFFLYALGICFAIGIGVSIWAVYTTEPSINNRFRDEFSNMTSNNIKEEEDYDEEIEIPISTSIYPGVIRKRFKNGKVVSEVVIHLLPNGGQSKRKLSQYFSNN